MKHAIMKKPLVEVLEMILPGWEPDHDMNLRKSGFKIVFGASNIRLVRTERSAKSLWREVEKPCAVEPLRRGSLSTPSSIAQFATRVELFVHGARGLSV